jgi:DNA-binding MarR family transcriptional regulator
VSIVLSKVQVDQVMRRASGENGHLSAMFYGLVEGREAMMASLYDVESHHLSRSLLAGLLLLSSFPEDGEYLGNAEVARLLGMNASTAHRYISTLVEVGLLERDPSTRRYRLAQ